MESTHTPEDVFSLLDKVPPVERTVPTDENQSMKSLEKHAIADDGPSKKCRFASPLSEKQIAEVCQPSISRHTQTNTSWGVSIFKEWCNCHNKDPWTMP